MARPLPPDEIFPAHRPDLRKRSISLRGGLEVRVVEGGAPDGLPVLLLHGWGASVYTYRHAFDRLGRHELRVVAADLRGFGLSGKPLVAGEYSSARYLDDVDQLLDALAVERTALVGHSMGGGVALQYALERPRRVASLALISPTNLVDIPLLTVPKLMPRELARLLGRRLVPRFAIEFILRWIAYGDPSLVTEEAIDQYWTPTQLPGYVFAARSTLSEFDWRPMSREQADQLTIPTVVMLGEKDRLVRGAGAAARSLRGATVHELPTGHCVHEELPDRVYEVIARHVLSAR